MATYSTNEFKSGLKVMLDGDPCSILENEFVKPGKGQAFNRVRLRNLKTNRVWEKTFKSGDSLEAADVMDREMQYLYNDGEFYHFMDNTTFEQPAVSAKMLGDTALYLKEGMEVKLTFYNDAPLDVEFPSTVDLKVIEAETAIRGDTATGVTKKVKTETGLEVQCPQFVKVGDVIRINTETGEYSTRV